MSAPNGTGESYFEELRLGLTHAMFHQDVTGILGMLTAVDNAGAEAVLEAEVTSANYLLERIENQRKLDQYIEPVSEDDLNIIKTLLKPPAKIKTLVIAALSLLGYQERDLKNWHFTHNVLNLRGENSVSSLMECLDIRVIPPDVALSARKLLGKITAEEICNNMVTTVGLYHWTQRVIEAVINKYGNDVAKARKGYA